MTRGRRFLFAVALATASLVALPATAPADTFRVRAVGDSPTNFRWKPSFRHITKGNRIRWKNTTSVTHRVTAYSANWSKDTAIAPGEATRKRFRKRGTYKYRCTVPGHSTLASDGSCSGMCGVIHVTRS